MQGIIVKLLFKNWFTELVLSKKLFIMRIRLINTELLQRYKGVKKRTAQREMRKIKDYFDKLPHHCVTNKEVAEYYGISVEDFEAILKE